MKRILILLLVQILSVYCFADNKIPDKLFGITLGGVYNENDFPVKEITGKQMLFGPGIHYYFKPIDGTTSQAFPYIERKEKPNDESYSTSFHTYIIPIIPNNVDSMDKLESLQDKDWKIEVVSIDWSDFPEKTDQKTEQKVKEDCYFWAIDLCKTFEAHFSSKPKIYDNYDRKTYICTFTANEKEFVIKGMGYKEVRLHYKEEIISKKSKILETFLRKIAAKKILPE
jgi:hypothetical protein